MSRKVDNLILAGLGVCLAMLPAMAHAPWPAVAGIAAVVAVVVVVIGGTVLHRSPVFADWPVGRKAAAVRWMWAAAATDVAMVVVLQVVGVRWWPVWLLGVCVLVAVQSGVAVGLEFWWRLPARSRPDREEQSGPGSELVPDHERSLVRADREWGDLTDDEKHMTAALATANHDWLRVVGGRSLRDDDGHVFGARLTLRVPASEVAKRGAEKCAPSAQLGELLAIALSEQLGALLESRWVAVRKDRAAGQYTVTVTSEDTMARLYPYVETPGPVSVREPAHVGYGIDAAPVRIALEQHVRYIGQTRGGKTSLFHTLLALLTRCVGNPDIADDAVVWVGAGVKAYDMLAGWLEIYQDTGLRMPFGWVTSGVDDVAQMLVALMVAARYRQSVPMAQRRWPAIICLLDEVSFTLGDKGVTVVYQGRKYTASKMGSMVAKAVGSARCWLHYGTQRGVNDEIGEEGGTIAAQTSAAFAFRNGDWQDVARTMGDWKIDPPVHQGETWIRGAHGEDNLVLSKARYIQEIDPSKPRLHDGPTLADVSWSRRHCVGELDPGTEAAIAAAVPAYANRSRVVDAEFMAYLAEPGLARTGGPDAGPPPATPEDEPDWLDGDQGDPAPDEVAAEVAAAAGRDWAGMSEADRRGLAWAVGIAMRERGVTTAEEFLASMRGQPALAPATPVAPESSTRAERIVRIVTDRPGVTSREIIAALRADGDECQNTVAVYNLLKRLAAPDGPLRKDEKGRFEPVQMAAAGHAP